MIRTRLINYRSLNILRFISHEADSGKRFIQTIPIAKEKPDFYSSLNLSNFKTRNTRDTSNSLQSSKWSSFKLQKENALPIRRSRTSRFKSKQVNNEPKINKEIESKVDSKVNTMTTTPVATEPITIPIEQSSIEQKTMETASRVEESAIEAPKIATPQITEEKPKKKKRVLKPRKAIITLSPSAIDHLKGLLEKPEGKFIRIGVQNRGCSGLTYNLEYVNEAGKFDELVEQDGVKVFVDSKALFSIVGSEMDWLDDKLSSRFIFKNPNSKGTCGCGESFMV